MFVFFCFFFWGCFFCLVDFPKEQIIYFSFIVLLGNQPNWHQYQSLRQNEQKHPYLEYMYLKC